MAFPAFRKLLPCSYNLQAFIFLDNSKGSQRKRKNCPLCPVRGLRKLSNHLADSHGVDGIDRKKMLKSAEDYSM